MKLQDSTALITGGTSGIGRAIAKSFVEAGAQVAVTGRDETRLEETARSLDVMAIRGDVGNESDVKRTFEEVFKAFGRLDVLVNNAGYGVFTPLVSMDRAEFDAVFQTNVTGAMLMGREAARYFVSQGSGNIVNIASTSALRGARNGTAYYASKFALRGMTECWRAELRPYNIRVFLVNPSEVLTNFAAVSGRNQDRDNPTKLRPDEVAHMVKAVLEMDDRGFTTELTIFATNPKD